MFLTAPYASCRHGRYILYKDLKTAKPFAKQMSLFDARFCTVCTSAWCTKNNKPLLCDHGCKRMLQVTITHTGGKTKQRTEVTWNRKRLSSEGLSEAQGPKVEKESQKPGINVC